MAKTNTWFVLAILLQLVLLYSFYKLFSNPGDNSGNRGSAGWSSSDWTVLSRAQLSVNWNAVKKIKRLPQDVDWTAVKKRSAPRKEEMHDKWIVITSINAPTKDVKKLAGMKGWKVVVVGDTKTPADWSHPNCVFLSVERQKELGYNIVDLLPYKHYGRKNIGYLYAIQRGAKQIYDTDDDNHPTSGKLTFYEKETGEFLIYKTDYTSVNPYAHFGQSTIWPRGYPLENISNPAEKTFVKCKNVQTAIQQGVVDGDPDVDAIYRLTRKDKDVRLDVKFDRNAPPVLLPPGTMAPFNSQNTFFLKKGLWATLLPVTTAFRVCDIWRGYWAQRLLWEVGGHLSFFPPNAVQYRSAHNYLLDFIDEKSLYHDSGRLVKFLLNWKSDKKDFFSRVLDLSIAMVEEGFWDAKDAVLTEAWLHDLVSIGYEIPELASTPTKCKEVSEEKVILKPKEQPSSYLRSGEKLVKIGL